jgi:uncharacterized protein Yka (UPF0111/DUF47 family)
MLFKKLLPREGNFFEMFDQHAERIVEAARAFSNLVANYADVNLREQYNREVDHAERQADKVTQEVITLAVFVPFAVLYLKEPLKLDYLWAALCMVGAVYFIFRNS